MNCALMFNGAGILPTCNLALPWVVSPAVTGINRSRSTAICCSAVALQHGYNSFLWQLPLPSRIPVCKPLSFFLFSVPQRVSLFCFRLALRIPFVCHACYLPQVQTSCPQLRQVCLSCMHYIMWRLGCVIAQVVHAEFIIEAAYNGTPITCIYTDLSTGLNLLSHPQ